MQSEVGKDEGLRSIGRSNRITKLTVLLYHKIRSQKRVFLKKIQKDCTNRIDNRQRLCYNNTKTLLRRQIYAFLEKEKELKFTLPSLEQKLEEMLQVLDQGCRTYNGVEYATREEAREAEKQTVKLQELISDCDFYSKEDIQKKIEEIKSLSLTVPVAEKVLEKLQTRLELLAFIPVNQIELLRLLMVPKIKAVICFVFFFGFVVFGTRESMFLAILCLILMIVSIMATRKNVMGFSEKFIQKKNFKAAALCSEITQQTKEEFMGNLFDN